jgi:hypothetical protein
MTVTVGVQNAQVRAVRDPDRLDSQADSPPGRTLSGHITTWTTLFSCQGAAPKGMIIRSAGLQFGLQFTLSYSLVHRSTRIRPDLRRERL